MESTLVKCTTITADVLSLGSVWQMRTSYLHIWLLFNDSGVVISLKLSRNSLTQFSAASENSSSLQLICRVPVALEREVVARSVFAQNRRRLVRMPLSAVATSGSTTLVIEVSRLLQLASWFLRQVRLLSSSCLRRENRQVELKQTHSSTYGNNDSCLFCL